MNRPPPWSIDASYRETDAWLISRGWTSDDHVRWRSEHRGRVTIATYGEAQKIQRRRDQAAKRRQPSDEKGSRR